MKYKGYVIYVDGDMVCNTDIAELWNLRDSNKAVQVVQHDYRTKVQEKYLGNKNEDYPRKNWSSVIIWNCQHAKNRLLDPAFISSKQGSFLHRFQWLQDNEIGSIPIEWNWLATEYESNAKAKLIHYTLGTPCFDAYRNSEMAGTWHSTFDRTTQGMNR